MNTSPAVKALVFDTFGTVVDWRGGIAKELSTWATRQHGARDWERFADQWRSRYQPQLERVRSGEIAWTKLDDLHAEVLNQLLLQFDLGNVDKAERRRFNTVWHRLPPWPDAVAGLTRLKRNYVIGPLSNGNVSLLVNLAKHSALPWDVLFSAEHFEHYKPHCATYLGVCRQLDLPPAEVMMCAAHNDDLRAARAQGLKTAFIVRPTEHGPSQTTDLVPETDWDIVATDFIDLARQLGA